jgi:allantoinase
VTGCDLVLRATRAVTPEGEVAADIGVADGRVVAVEPLGSALRGRRTVRLDEDVVLLPGLVDTHVHVNEPGRTQWEGFATATRAAAAGGITTIIDMPLNSVPATVDVPALETKRRAAEGQCVVDVGFWGGAVPGNLDALRSLHDAGVFGVKCFLLDSGVPEFDPLGPAELDDYLASRPRAAEDLAIAGLIDAARRTGGRVHVVHLSSADAIPLIRDAQQDGVRISAETCPHYLVFTAEEVPDAATQFKCCPPIREAGNRELLWGGLADGTIDCVVSDHSPCTPDLKRLDVGDFGLAWGGIAGLQVGLPAVWTEARRRGCTLRDVVRWMAERPARLAGLRRKGRIAVGNDADFCAFAPDETFVVDPAALHHRNPVTPYAGRPLAGVVRATWLRGAEVLDDEEPRGRLLTRGEA